MSEPISVLTQTLCVIDSAVANERPTGDVASQPPVAQRFKTDCLFAGTFNLVVGKSIGNPAHQIDCAAKE